MPTLSDTDIPISNPSPEYPNQPEAPAPGQTGNLTLTRKRAIGNATTRIDASKTIALPTITPGAQSAVLIVEAAPGGNTASPLIRFWQDGTWPSTIAGMPAYHGSPIEIIGSDDLANFRAVSVDGLNHKINVQYFSYL